MKKTKVKEVDTGDVRQKINIRKGLSTQPFGQNKQINKAAR